MANPWTCIVLTCSNISWSKVLENAINAIKTSKSNASIGNETAVLSATDPETNIGSGAATLNALFIVTEYLSAQKNFTAVTADVLQDCNILILHHGRDYVYDIGGKGLINIPCVESEVQTNLEHLIGLMTRLKSKSRAPGVWICSTDASFSGIPEDFPLTFDQEFDEQQCTVFCVNSDVVHASQHGVMVSDINGNVQNIIYCGETKQLDTIAKNEQVQLISGIVYFPRSVAERLLSFHTIAPLNSCTYVGVDGGSEPLKMSLFFDIIVALIRSISEEDYLTGTYGNLYNVKAGLGHQRENTLFAARKIIWKHLSKFSLKAVTVQKLAHRYWDERFSAKQHLQNVFSFGKTGIFQSFVQSQHFASEPQTLVINSSIECQSLTVKVNSLITNSEIKGDRICIGSNCFLSSVQIDVAHDSIVIPDKLCILGLGTNSNSNQKFHVVFGIDDNLHAEVDITSGTFCNVSWEDWFKITALSLEDVWTEEPKTLWNAKLFARDLGIEFYIQLFSGYYNELLQVRWKGTERFSAKDLMQTLNIEDEVNWRQQTKSNIACSQIAHSIENNTNQSFLQFFKLACSEGWQSKILNTLDATAAKLENRNYELCRTLSCIADMLGTMAGTLGRLRSGPGNNKAWITAFNHIRNDQPGLAVVALKDMRDKWLAANLVVRAARHYESALQVFIQNAVKSAKVFVHLTSCPVPEVGQWVTAECPSRVDLQGGWSDTPPICYELGGSVVNAAVLIDGKRPIGAKVKRIQELSIYCITSFKFDNFIQELKISSLDALSDYNQPYANGALLKAAVICAQLVDLTTDRNLQDQLQKYDGGFEVHCWSCLPQGTGLGTSSILAACIIAALWTASGRSYTKTCLLHAVLYVEQLLTTGGGWQDQVGGVMGGINRGHSGSTLPLEIKVEHIPIRESFMNVLNNHFFLIYTGKVRLAKNLLQNVIRNWYAREESVVTCFKELVANSCSIAEAFRNEDLEKIGELMNKYWDQKQILAPGCEPDVVRQLMKVLKDVTLGQLLVGAGGGGYMCILTKEQSSIECLQSRIMQLPFADTVTVHSVTIDTKGLVVKVEDTFIDVAT